MAASGGNNAAPPQNRPVTPFDKLKKLVESRTLIVPADRRGYFSLTEGMDAALEEARGRALTDAGAANEAAVQTAFNTLQDNMHAAVNSGRNVETALQSGLDTLKTTLKPLVADSDDRVNAILGTDMAAPEKWLEKVDFARQEKRVETEMVRQLAKRIENDFAYSKSDEYLQWGHGGKKAVWEADPSETLQREWSERLEWQNGIAPVAAEVAVNGAEAKAAEAAAQDTELEAILRTNARKLQKNIEANKPTYFTSPDLPIYAIKRDTNGLYSYSAVGGLFPHTREWWYKLKINPFTPDNVFLPLIQQIDQTQELLKKPIARWVPDPNDPNQKIMLHPENVLKGVLTKPPRSGNEMPYEYTKNDIKSLRRFMETAQNNGYPVVIHPKTYDELVKLKDKDNQESHAFKYICRGLAMVALKTAAVALSVGIGAVGVGIAAACGLVAMAATVCAGVLDVLHLAGRAAVKGVGTLLDKAWTATGHDSFMSMGPVKPNDFFSLSGKMLELSGNLYKSVRDLHVPTLWAKNILKSLWDGAGTLARSMTSTLAEDIDRLFKDFDNTRLGQPAPAPADAQQPGIGQGQQAPPDNNPANMANMGANPVQEAGELKAVHIDNAEEPANIQVDLRGPVNEVGVVHGGLGGETKEAYNTLAEFVYSQLGLHQGINDGRVLGAFQEIYPGANIENVTQLKGWLDSKSTEERQAILAPVLEKVLTEPNPAAAAEEKVFDGTGPVEVFAKAGQELGFNVEYYKGVKDDLGRYASIAESDERPGYSGAAEGAPVMRAVYSDSHSPHCDLLIQDDARHLASVNAGPAADSEILAAARDANNEGLKTAVEASAASFRVFNP